MQQGISTQPTAANVSLPVPMIPPVVVVAVDVLARVRRTAVAPIRTFWLTADTFT